MGVVSLYIILNCIFNDIVKKAKKDFKRVVLDLNGIIIYNNFNFKNIIREIVSRK